MHMIDELGNACIGVNDSLREFPGMARRISNAFNTVNFGHVIQQQSEVRRPAVGRLSSVGVDILPEKRHLLDALIGKLRGFHQHVNQRTGNFFAAGIRHHAVRTVLRAAFHDGDEGSGAVSLGSGQMIELFNFGKAHVDLSLTGFHSPSEKLRQTVQRLRAENRIDERRPADDVFALLTGHAAADGNQHAGTRLFDLADASEIGKRFFLSLLPDGAGIHDDEIGLFENISFLIAHLGLQKVGNAAAVVIIHLAAEAAEVEFLRLHGLYPVTMENECSIEKAPASYTKSGPFEFWWRITDSNRGHKDYDSSALTD